MEKYYPLGVTDPDYTVLRFTSQWGNYYHALSNVTFELSESGKDVEENHR